MISKPHFNGPVYDTDLDHRRLYKQHERIRDIMLDGVWRSLSEIERLTGFPQASISAQLRHLRKPRFGAYLVERKRVSGGLYEYRVSAPAEQVEFAFTGAA